MSRVLQHRTQSPLLRAVRQDLSKPRCFRSRIRIIQKPDCRTPDARRVSWLNRTDLFWASRTARARVPEGLPGRGGLPEYACFTLSEPNMVGPSPLCPTPRHIVASTFRRGVALAIGMRILNDMRALFSSFVSVCRKFTFSRDIWGHWEPNRPVVFERPGTGYGSGW